LGATAILSRYKGQQIVERRHRDLKQTLRVRPIFLHKDERIHALVSIIGIALLVFGLIEAELRKRWVEATDGEQQLMPGLLPEGRAARPTGRNVLGAFQGLGLTYTARRHRPRPAHRHSTADPGATRHRRPLARTGQLDAATRGKWD
jgi:transposase